MKEPRSGAWSTATSSEEPPERYERIERIGQGGMGTVWRARDNRLRRDVALKSVTPDATEEVRKRLVQEARLAGHLNHPGVVRVLDQGIDTGGKPFYVMEILRFPLLGRGRDRDLRAMVEVARTIGHAHSAGLVHRDLKPSNLGLRGDQPVVADWGLARPYGDDRTWSEEVLQSGGARTRTGVAMGTVGYLAPEQMTGGPADPRADVWSLGAILYEVVAERTPYDELGSHRLLNEVVSGERLLPGDPVGDVIRRALALKPENRFATGNELAEALERALPTGPEAPPRTPWVMLALTAIVFGMAASLLTRPAPSDHANIAAEALAEHGWMLYRDGYTLDALEKVSRSSALAVTPLARGLATAALNARTTPLPTPTGCEDLILDPEGDARLCLRSGGLSLHASDGTLRWERRVDGIDRADVRDGTTRIHTAQGWEEIDATGNTRARYAVDVEDYALAGDRVWKRSGWGVEGTDLTDVLGFGPRTSAGVLASVRHARTLVLRADGTTVEGPSFGEPVVAWRADVDGITLVGLRGQVLRLDAELRETARYQLAGASQVLAAAIGVHEEIAVSSENGVVIYQHRLPMLQASRKRVDSLTFGDDGVLVFFDGDALRRVEPGRRHLGHASGGSITAIHGTGNHLLVGSDLGMARLDGELLRGPLEVLPIEGPIRQFAPLSRTSLMVGPGQVWDGVSSEGLAYTSAVSLADDSAILLKRHSTALARRIGDRVLHIPPAPVPLTWLEPTYTRRSLLGLTREGDVWAAKLEGEELTWADTGLDDVRKLADSPHGLFVGRGSTASLVGKWSHDLGSSVSAVAASSEWLVAGTLKGEVWVFDPNGVLQARMPAHAERVSALFLEHDQLYSGSWAPGLRRWDLSTLRRKQ